MRCWLIHKSKPSFPKQNESSSSFLNFSFLSFVNVINWLKIFSELKYFWSTWTHPKIINLKTTPLRVSICLNIPLWCPIIFKSIKNIKRRFNFLLSQSLVLCFSVSQRWYLFGFFFIYFYFLYLYIKTVITNMAVLGFQSQKEPACNNIKSFLLYCHGENKSFQFFWIDAFTCFLSMFPYFLLVP